VTTEHRIVTAAPKLPPAKRKAQEQRKRRRATFEAGRAELQAMKTQALRGYDPRDAKERRKQRNKRKAAR
jgi:hypothetical protein